jgi:NAD(P)-dependent dehydrogenase (short-subunit alcohol dehydrogenase family)
MGRLQDRVAIITGAGDGIGRGIARRFAAEGASVLVAELNAESGPAVVAELRDLGAEARYLRTDVGAKDDNLAMVATAVETWGTVDILVNNAWGGGSLGRVERKTDEAMDHAMRVGFLGPFWAMQAAYPVMKAKGYGRVINICSLNGVNAHMGTADYNTAKEALRTLTRSAAREWAPTGVVANVICPGALTGAARAVFAANPELKAQAEASVPMGRLGDPEDDIAPVAVFLASDDCRYMTGNTLFVGGGTHINGSAWAPNLPDDE